MKFMALLIVMGLGTTTLASPPTGSFPTVLTIEGSTYSNVTLLRYSPATFTIRYPSGILSFPITDLNVDLQAQLNYNAETAAKYLEAQQNNQSRLLEIHQSRQEAIETGPEMGDTASAIAGAFGLALGGRIDASKWHPIDKGSEWNDSYAFEASDPVTGFTNYFFSATPKTHIIYSIRAETLSETDLEGCKRRQAVVFAMLQQKYGLPDKSEDFVDGFEKGFSGKVQFTRGRRYIVLDRTLFGPSVLLLYGDFDLQHQAEQEQIELDAAKTQGHGL